MFNSINKFAQFAATRSEVVGAVMIVLMVAMMVIPLSPMMLDVLLAINISVSIVLVITAMLIESPLSFASFPAVLLMTTLFRLALTISTTRQILLEADAGHIVQTFGEFVVGGNVAVGLVIFLIISVVNFLVITKGSERVAEVAARFSLDGMPGKQMSIDSDLRAGLINQAIAKQRRSDLEKESQLFGAMDGAIKFVKNDAIAGLVITVVNLLGGLTIGMLQKDMNFAQAGHVYTILSVGDGLVSIIPSLMVSIAAGLIVTRVNRGEVEGSSTAQDMMRDLARNGTALQISGVVCILFAMVPGMPSLVFLAAGGGLIYGWYRTTGQGDKPVEVVDVSGQVKDIGNLSRGQKMEDVLLTTTYSAVEIRIPKGVEPTTANLLENICRVARNQVVEELGILIPIFEFIRHDEPNLEIYVYGVPSLTVDLSDKRVAIRTDNWDHDQYQAELEYVSTKDVVTGRWNLLCEPHKIPLLNQLGLPFISFEELILERVRTLMVRKVSQLFTLNECQRHMVRLGDLFAEQLKELERVLPATKAVDVVQRLLHEWVSIKNMRSILNSLIEWGQRERDPSIITEQVRRGLHEQICHQYAHERKLQVFTLSLDIEQLIRESGRSDGSTSFLDVDAASLNELVEVVEGHLRPYLETAIIPAVVCSIDCRMFFRQMIEDQLFVVPVLSHQEVSTNFQIQVLGNITLDMPSDSEAVSDPVRQ